MTTAIPNPQYTGNKFAAKGIADETRRVLPFEPWMAYGACRLNAIDTVLFFATEGPGKRKAINYAKKVCALCNYREECLTYAITNNIFDGVWGGKTREERREIIRSNRLIASPLPFTAESPYG